MIVLWLIMVLMRFIKAKQHQRGESIFNVSCSEGYKEI